MAQENEDVTAKFSTLNVNAMEFVPSFGMCQERNENSTNEEPNESKTPENNG